MGNNLPPGVSVSDLPGNDPGPEPECYECGSYPSTEAMEDGYPLCEDHDTPENRAHYDEEIARVAEEQAAMARAEEAEQNAPLPDPPHVNETIIPVEEFEFEDVTLDLDYEEGVARIWWPNSDEFSASDPGELTPEEVGDLAETMEKPLPPRDMDTTKTRELREAVESLQEFAETHT